MRLRTQLAGVQSRKPALAHSRRTPATPRRPTKPGTSASDDSDFGGSMKSPTVRALKLAIVVLSTFLTLTPYASAQIPDNELSQDIAKLDSFLSDRNLDLIEATVNKDSVKWKQRDRPSYITYMAKACSLLSSYDIGDLSKRALLLSRY